MFFIPCLKHLFKTKPTLPLAVQATDPVVQDLDAFSRKYFVNNMLSF